MRVGERVVHGSSGESGVWWGNYCKFKKSTLLYPRLFSKTSKSFTVYAMIHRGLRIVFSCIFLLRVLVLT
jgi:hypothetical protein